MLYQFIVIVSICTKNLCLKFFQNILITFVVKQREFCGFSEENFTFASVILGLSSSFSVQVSVLCSRVLAVYLLACLLLDLGKFLELY
jgi:hypothetical protein